MKFILRPYNQFDCHYESFVYLLTSQEQWWSTFSLSFYPWNEKWKKSQNSAQILHLIFDVSIYKWWMDRNAQCTPVFDPYFWRLSPIINIQLLTDLIRFLKRKIEFRTFQIIGHFYMSHVCPSLLITSYAVILAHFVKIFSLKHSQLMRAVI